MRELPTCLCALHTVTVEKKERKKCVQTQLLISMVYLPIEAMIRGRKVDKPHAGFLRPLDFPLT